MPDTLSVHLNRERPRDLAPEATTLETDRSFVLSFVNHGQPLHVHVQPDERLADIATVSETQVYVAANETRTVDVVAPRDAGPADGTLRLVTGHGAESENVTVSITQERKDGGPDVAVDDTLTEKQSRPEPDTGVSLRHAVIPVAVVVAVVAAAGAIAVAVPDAGAVVVGVAGVLAGCGVGAYELLR
ncbi:hypothetical protein PNP85_08460 [Halobacterium salinarum]|uniref:Uncharacterized protein n=1 Tax=Halobacterium salinarum (strain ATCC 33171 / DSM 3754 / JCM 8978 / NBRC 102687 / NCIMB 764 / 91-R6) TaxID=2597657 RepID=A0A4D6GT37_HALS9|nr:MULTISPECIES: hypothetical protein [Halobacterium]MCF2164996.1 hypothetical protein [Halobacterium salinarum]MCF2168667.1 hypothetical protein [Halobacterium salinarum]MCF2238179.1 hypothetical protein [Halobacterium salinarum]MDL0139535.1 hypothetical protein [Halobacterium salinarum]MDL0145442.1 hypothetical protein [Halobacterium salinarum]